MIKFINVCTDSCFMYCCVVSFKCLNLDSLMPIENIFKSFLCKSCNTAINSQVVFQKLNIISLFPGTLMHNIIFKSTIFLSVENLNIYK